MRIFNIAAGHADDSPNVFITMSGIRREKVSANGFAFAHNFRVVGATSLYDKVFYHSVKLCVVEIVLLSEINEIGFMIFDFIEKLDVYDSKIGGQSDFVFRMFFGIIVKKSHSIIIGKVGILPLRFVEAISFFWESWCLFVSN